MTDAIATRFKTRRSLDSCGVRIEVDPHGFVVTTDGRADRVLTAEIYCGGLLVKSAIFSARSEYRDSVVGLNPAQCGVRVLDAAGAVIAVLDVELDPYPFMRRQGEQRHVTENYVSVPPALTITDDVGDVWTLGMTFAPREKSPDGEYAFPVLRNGIDMREVASRIERRSGKVKIFTCEGWKVWTGESFF